MAKQARLQGLIVGSRRHQTDFVRAIDAAEIKPVIDRSFDLDKIADAFRYEASGKHFSKIGLTFLVGCKALRKALPGASSRRHDGILSRCVIRARSVFTERL